VTESVDGAFSNERNTLAMMGAGPIEMLAREMTAELTAIREAALLQAQILGVAVTRPLSAKGVAFGSITVLPDGRVDPTAIEGVDWDLIVKPFHQKGAVVSLREFSNNAMNHHHGMQSVERFDLDTDPDGDGVTNELTVGDITAVTVFQAQLNTPGRLLPASHARRAAAERGEQLFSAIRCAKCHVPAMVLNSPLFTEPNPYNPNSPDKNLQVSQVGRLISFDMTRDGPEPRLERLRDGRALVRAFTDLKRHDLNDSDYDHCQRAGAPRQAERFRATVCVHPAASASAPAHPSIPDPEALGCGQLGALRAPRRPHHADRGHLFSRRRSAVHSRLVLQPLHRRSSGRHRVPEDPADPAGRVAAAGGGRRGPRRGPRRRPALDRAASLAA
jgi:hypothetical protein